MLHCLVYSDTRNVSDMFPILYFYTQLSPGGTGEKLCHRCPEY